MLLEDSKKSIEICDASWHMVREGEEKKLAELRISKMAAQYVVNILDTYKHDLEMAQKNLTDLIGYGVIIPKYYDVE